MTTSVLLDLVDLVVESCSDLHFKMREIHINSFTGPSSVTIKIN